MSFANVLSLKPGRTLALRLTVWYAAIFAASSLLAFALAYALVAGFVAERTDDELREDLRDFAALREQQGVEGVQREIALDTQGHEASKVYFRLWAADGRLLDQSALAAWPQLDRPSLAALGAASTEAQLGRFERASKEDEVRTALGGIGGGVVIEIGRSLDDDRDFLDEMLRGFVLALCGVLLLGAPIGWFMARRSLRGVEHITNAAVEIADGALDRRVSVGAHGDELDRLARTFNTMLDRIQTLILGMRDMADNLAHDLRGPLARLRAGAELSLADGTPTPAHMALVSDTIEECDRLLAMLNTTLDIAEADAGAAKLDMAHVDLAEIVRAAAEVFQTVADDGKVALSVDTPPTCSIIGDRQRLQRVIANLIDNASKYTPAGGHVLIALHRQASRVLLTIEDTGMGIAADELSRIFQRFYRADRSRSQRGVGLGLSLAQSFVRAHGGDITVSSRPAAGSTFAVALPAAPEPAA